MSRRARPTSPLALVFCFSLVAALVVTVAPPPAGAETIFYCDVDADGYSDLTVGAPREDLGGARDVGAFSEFHGSPAGLTAIETWWVQNEPGQRNGEATICGDFNSDGYDDIALGVPYKDVGTRENAGRVEIIYGGPQGLGTSIASDIITQDTPRVRGRSEAVDVFGFDLTWCNFDGDDYADLAVGIPGQDVNGVRSAGAVQIFYGGPDGILRANGNAGRNQIITQDSPGMADQAEPFDQFGEYLTAAQVDDDEFCDLIVGVPSEDVGSKVNAGAIEVIFGSATGLSRRSQVIHRDSPRINGVATAFERFGAPLFFGNFDTSNTGREIVVGVPGQDVAGQRDAGAVHLLAVDGRGVTGRGDRIITQNSLGVAGRAQANDQFGRSIITGLFNGDAELDLAIGVPGERISGMANAGQVQILFGNGSGLARKGRIVARGTQAGAFLGATLAGGDFDADGFSDIAIGLPYFDWALGNRTARDAGAVLIARGGRAGLRGQGSAFLSQRTVIYADGTFSPFRVRRGVTKIEDCDAFGNFNPGLVLPIPPGVESPRCAGGRSRSAFDPFLDGYGPSGGGPAPDAVLTGPDDAPPARDLGQSGT